MYWLNKSLYLSWLVKNTCFKPLVKMDMSIGKKRLISQLGAFEKPRILVVSALEIVPHHLRLH